MIAHRAPIFLRAAGDNRLNYAPKPDSSSGCGFKSNAVIGLSEVQWDIQAILPPHPNQGILGSQCDYL